MSLLKPAGNVVAQPQPANQDPARNVQALLVSAEKQIAAALPRHMTASRMARIALTECRKNPELLACDPMSFIGAVIQCSQLGLEPGSGLGHAYLIPFNNRKRGIKEVTMIPGYRGLIDLALRSERVASIEAELVYEKDAFKIRKGDDAKIDHEPFLGGDAGKITGCYAIAHLKGSDRPKREYMTRAQLDAHKDRFSKGNPVWETDYDQMCRKTLVRRICKYLPMSPELARAIELEDRDDGQENWRVIDASYEPKQAPADPEKMKAEIAAASNGEAMATPAEKAKAEADHRVALSEFRKASEFVANRGGNPDDILGDLCETVADWPTNRIFASIDRLASWKP